MLTATIETIRSTLIIFMLANGGTREMISDEEMCFLARVMLSEDMLYVEDTDLPRQKPIGVECRCVEQ